MAVSKISLEVGNIAVVDITRRDKAVSNIPLGDIATSYIPLEGIFVSNSQLVI